MGWLDLPVSALAATELQEQKVTAKIPISMRELQIFLGFAGRTAIVTIPTGSISASQQRVNLCDSCVGVENVIKAVSPGFYSPFKENRRSFRSSELYFSAAVADLHDFCAPQDF